MRFQSDQYFSYLLLVPILIFFSWLWGRKIMDTLNKNFGERLTPFLTSSVSLQRRRWKLIFQSVVVGLMVVALARPQSGQSKSEIKSQGVELMFMVDVSDSMMAEDVKPNRLEQAKIELGKLIEKMPGNKVGIIAFAGSSVLLSPLTTDPAALKMYLDSLTTLSVSSQGTHFSSGLQEAIAAFERGGATNSPVARVTRVILVASDGEDHEQGAIDIATQLTEKGVRIFTLAYGTEKGGAIPERDSMGFLRGYKKDRSGKEVVTSVKGDALRALASAGKGSFYHATFGGGHLDSIAADIDKLEKAEFDSEFVTQYDEKFQIFLTLAFIFGILELILGERRKSQRVWKGRFEVGL